MKNQDPLIVGYKVLLTIAMIGFTLIAWYGLSAASWAIALAVVYVWIIAVLKGQLEMAKIKKEVRALTEVTQQMMDSAKATIEALEKQVAEGYPAH